MSVAREEPYPRGASMSRSQSKRYEQQRRQINQQETPQPNLDQEQAYSRDHSVERTPADEAVFSARPTAREYVSVQDRLHPYSPPRYRYEGYPEDHRGPPPFYVDEYDRPVEEYELVRVARNRGPYLQPTPGRYVEHDEQVQYVPISYGRVPPQRYQVRQEYAYYPERQPNYPERQPAVRGPAFEAAEEAYEPPPDIKVEQPPSVADGA